MPTEPILGIPFEVWMVTLTAAVVAAAILQAFIYAGMHRTTKRVERAYVDMSHVQPGIIEFEPDKPIRIQIAITNHGHTPADVVAVVVERFVGTELPPSFPDIRPTEPQNLFLMPNAPAYWHPDEGLAAVPAQSYEAIKDPENTLSLWVIGYVDYIDRFGTRRRNHFTRKFDPLAKPRNTLVNNTFTYVLNNLLIEAKPGYSDDVEIDEHGNPKG